MKSISRVSLRLESSAFGTDVCKLCWSEHHLKGFLQTPDITDRHLCTAESGAWSSASSLKLSQAARRRKVGHLSREWHHSSVWLCSFYPPYCHCCTWPPGTADGTCGRTCQVCPPALAWCLCAAGCLRIPTPWPASPCRWCSPGIAERNASSAAVPHDCVFTTTFTLSLDIKRRHHGGHGGCVCVLWGAGGGVLTPLWECAGVFFLPHLAAL